MGTIKHDIEETFFSQHPKHLEFLRPFLHCFKINYAAQKESANTVLYSYILEAENFMKEAFGFDKEILLVYSPYDNMEPRTIQALYSILKEFPFKNRVDSLNCMLISDDNNVVDWLHAAALGGDSSQIIIPFSKGELIQNKSDAWYIRNKLRDNFFGVDLFAYSLPLNDDLYFFGRQQITARIIDAIKRCENHGIFGLRKTGKTSLLFKIDRIIREQHLGFVFFYDCKSPSYRKMHWNQLLGEICDNIAARLGIWIKKDYGEESIIRSFRYVMKEASLRNKKIILMFDEIEYISFLAPLDHHWKNEFIDFWQTIWSVQSRHRNLVFIISGVNPRSIETDTINLIQNPLFGIVQSEYLCGLSQEDTRVMLKTLGKRMGLKFTHDAVDFLYKQYGGHPMLTRLAASKINQTFDKGIRPIDITYVKVKSMQEEIDSELTYYFSHVVSEIQQFYPEEYEMFEMLASGQTSDFIELSQISEFSKHLYDYGLVIKNCDGTPVINMPVAGRYAAIQLAKRENRMTLYRIVEREKRTVWVSQRVQAITRDLRQLERAIISAATPKLYGENSFPEADSFVSLSEVDNKAEFIDFINICNRCFVEPIENYGISIGKRQYFWNEIKTSYSALHSVLERIKIYRHSQDHAKLKPTVAQKYKTYWEEDTTGLTDIKECYFCIQQKVLDGLFSSIQVELNRLT